jgi:hypothetical protein
MNVLTRLDTLTQGKFFSQCALIAGASGGMIGCSLFQGTYLQKQEGKISSLQQSKYIDNICKDLLNPVFSSLVARDMIGPISNFELNGNSYIRDRGYAFEQKLNANTKACLIKNCTIMRSPNKQLPFLP